MNNENNLGNGQKPNNNKKPGGNNRIILMMIMAIAAVMIIMNLVSGMTSESGSDEEISYNQFIEYVEEGKVEKVQISSTVIEITMKPETEADDTTAVGHLINTASQESYYTGMVGDEEELKNYLTENGVEIYGEIPSTSSIWTELLLTILPFGLIILFYMYIFRKGGMMGNLGKTTAKVYMQKETGITFDDVAGEDEAKESLMEIVDFLHNPGRYSTIGAKLPKGALLVGPPGTGKTLLAKAVAGEAKVPFFSLSGSEFVEMFVGMGASRVRDLFKQAQQNAPCIIFIDEIDAIGKSRDARYGGDSEREQTLNQLLAEMDGFDSAKGIFILAATNRPEVLDKALLRPGRFDRRIIVEKPDLKGRVAILKVHAKDVRLDDTVDFQALALATSGAVGSDLANMINEAAINAVKHGRDVVSQNDLLEAVEVVLVGKEKKDRIMGEQERRMVSYHEVGHALVSALQKDSEPVQKITIVPRTMGALGFTMNVPEEEKYMNTKAELQAMLVQFVGGRAAEELVFDTVTTGAANDIERATSLARAMVTQYGMSDEFGLMGLESIESRYLDGRPVQNCADETEAKVDAVVKKMLQDAYDTAKKLLSDNMDALHRIAAFLIEKETITGKEFLDILHQVQAEREEARNALEARIQAGEFEQVLNPESETKEEIKEDSTGETKADTAAETAKEETKEDTAAETENAVE
jgi:cell division protease FtsH